MAKKNKIAKVLLSSVTCLALAVPMGAGFAMADEATATNGVTKYQSAYESYEEVEKAAADVNEEIMEESITLLKNDGALPFGKKVKNISVFGVGGATPSYGSYGSGTQKHTEYVKQVTLLESIENGGYKTNPALNSMYSKLGNADKALGGGKDVENMTDFANIESSYTLYGDAALIVVTRTGGEGLDFSMDKYYDGTNTANNFDGRGGAKAEAGERAHTLMLNPAERRLVEYVTGKFDKVVVLLNSPNPLELAELEDNDKIGGILWVGSPGANGFESVGKVLNGEVNPSGHTVDMYPARFDKDPSWANYGLQQHTNAEGKPDVDTPVLDKDGNGVTYVSGGMFGSSPVYAVTYEEGIYMGYRWYETQAELGNYYTSTATNMPNNKSASYDTTDAYYNRDNGVVYPFGYGLSYTEFEWKVIGETTGTITAADQSITIKVEVTNIGKVAGKDVVQVYYKDPYINGEIEKASANLVQFAKTELLDPGESQTLTITFDVKDMASFDYNDANHNNKKNYELDEGNYEITLRTDSHNVKQDCTITYSLAEKIVYDGSDAAHNFNNGYGNNAEAIFSESEDKNSSNWLYSTLGDSNISKYISRKDGTLPMPEPPKAENNKYSDDWITRIKAFESYSAANDNDDLYKNQEYIVKGVPDTWTQGKSGTTLTKLSALAGLDYPTYTRNAETGVVTAGTDEATVAWDNYLNQLTLEEMETLVTSNNMSSLSGGGMFGGSGLARASELGIPSARANDGGTQFIGNIRGIWWCSETNVAETWNVELSAKKGAIVGEESLYNGFTGLWGAGMNTHRSPFCGRNFEYFSQDGVQGGIMAAAQYKASQDKGVVVYIKHFALNEQDAYRNNGDGCATFLTEQSFRQIYLKPFEMCIKDAGVSGFMCSFMRIGAISADNNYNLITKLARGEWGFEGETCTDAFAGASADIEFRAGNDTPLGFYGQTLTTNTWDATGRGGKGTVMCKKSSGSNTPSIPGFPGGGETPAVTALAETEESEPVESLTQYYSIRNNAMHILYTYANCNAMTNVDVTAFVGNSSLTANINSSLDINLAAATDKLGTDNAVYTLADGKLPAGVTLTADGKLTGTVTENGTFTFSVKMTADAYLVSTQSFTLTVSDVIKASASAGTLNDEDFEIQLSAVNNPVTGTTFALKEGKLPTGTTLATDGLIYGTPTEAGEFTFTVEMTVGTDKYTQTLTVTVAEEEPTPQFRVKDGMIQYSEDGVNWIDVIEKDELKGDQGLKGDTGLKGDQGPKGDKGDDGEKGSGCSGSIDSIAVSAVALAVVAGVVVLAAKKRRSDK